MNRTKTGTISYSLVHDIGILVKFKLSLMVVFSSALSYIILAKDHFNWTHFVLLCAGGLSVTFAANALNQCLERDYDKLMVRTAMRPVADGRMTVSMSVLISGLLCMVGVIFLALISPEAATLGMLSFVIYAFVYTPLKRYSTMAIPVGAVPGALPALIAGVVACQGFTWEAILLFGIQYLWQFPHFWAIAWLGHEDYTRAGYRLINDVDGRPDPKYGLYAAVYAILSLVFLAGFVYMDQMNFGIALLLMLAILSYSAFGWNLYRRNDARSARLLMFSSIIYLPLVLLLFLINNFMS
ncbi:MAG TPA: protoheme IX farnesyltransferase [Saprospiraceae bacterium]|nr:protoheme IX farnesyltransferase [Saprospiraceae bacterium]